MSPRAYSAILFDLDGTLINSAPGIHACLQHALKSLGLPPAQKEALDATIGLPLDEAMERVLDVPLALVSQASQAYRDHWYIGGVDAWSWYPQMEPLLEYLTQNSKKCVLATAKAQVGAENSLKRIGWADRFHAASGTQPGETGKAGVVKRALATLSAEDTAVMVGDRIPDALAAQANGIPFIKVGWGYGAGDDFSSISDMAEAHSPEALKDLLSP